MTSITRFQQISTRFYKVFARQFTRLQKQCKKLQKNAKIEKKVLYVEIDLQKEKKNEKEKPEK